MSEWDQCHALMKRLTIEQAWTIHRNEAEGAHTRVEREAARRVLMADLRGQWSHSRGVTEADGKAWFGRLLGKEYVEADRLDGLPKKLPGDDHVSLWLKDGTPHIYVSQPYHFDFDTVRQMTATALIYGLKFSVKRWPAWWNPERILFVEWRRQESEESI